MLDISEAIEGSILGTMIGEALALPYRGDTPQNIPNTFTPVGEFHGRPGKGLVSSATDIALMSFQSLFESAENSTVYRDQVAKRLKIYPFCLPSGLSSTTLRSSIEMLFGKSTGLYSAGVTPVLRAPVLGIIFHSNMLTLQRFLKEVTSITHTDPKPLFGAVLIAVATIEAIQQKESGIDEFLDIFNDATEGFDTLDLSNLVRKAYISGQQNEDAATFAVSIGLGSGVTSYVYHIVPVVMHAWFRHRTNLHAGIKELIVCGGDTTNLAAIYGAIVGAQLGKHQLPGELLDGLSSKSRHPKLIKAHCNKFAEIQRAKGRTKAPTLKLGTYLVENILVQLNRLAVLAARRVAPIGRIVFDQKPAIRGIKEPGSNHFFNGEAEANSPKEKKPGLLSKAKKLAQRKPKPGTDSSESSPSDKKYFGGILNDTQTLGYGDVDTLKRREERAKAKKAKELKHLSKKKKATPPVQQSQAVPNKKSDKKVVSIEDKRNKKSAAQMKTLANQDKLKPKKNRRSLFGSVANALGGKPVGFEVSGGVETLEPQREEKAQ